MERGSGEGDGAMGGVDWELGVAAELKGSGG